ncbi:unnamed protein product [Euphydryas editha]|uniref:Uncharacterized protein n=1 Tax=Euphydryas editha TaxID=104508 RepID=A0AAU9UZI7_EUPED|nr:unnamed protein product [Euphydryas editha]
MANICPKTKSDSSLEYIPMKKMKCDNVVETADTVVETADNRRTVATMCGSWRPEETDGGLIFVFKTRDPGLSPDPRNECDFPENIEDFWEASLVNVDIEQKSDTYWYKHELAVGVITFRK